MIKKKDYYALFIVDFLNSAVDFELYQNEFKCFMREK